MAVVVARARGDREMGSRGWRPWLHDVAALRLGGRAAVGGAREEVTDAEDGFDFQVQSAAGWLSRGWIRARAC